MADWEWRAYDLATGVSLGDDRDGGLVALRRAQRRRVVVGDDDRAQHRGIRRDYLAATTPGKTVVVPIRDGVPFGFAGIVWSRDAPKIAGAGLLSYFDRQPLNVRKAYVATDQHTIVKDLVDWVQANGGNIGSTPARSARRFMFRDQTWEQWEEKNIGEAIRQKGDNIGGFDFDIRVEYDTGVLVRRLRLWTPRRGRYFVDDQSNPTFRLDGRRGNVRTVPSTPVDATKLSTHVYALGQEIDATTHERLRSKRPHRPDRRRLAPPRRSARPVRRQDLTTLQAHADGLAYLYGPTDVDEIVLDVDPTPRTVDVGDVGSGRRLPGRDPGRRDGAVDA
jgi:hypothetical protein